MIIGTYGGWCLWSRVGTELHRCHDTKQQQAQVEYYVLKVIWISHTPATGKNKQNTLNPQDKNPIAFNPQQNTSKMSPQEICEMGSSYNTSEGFLYSIFCLNIFQVCWSPRFYFPTSVLFLLGNIFIKYNAIINDLMLFPTCGVVFHSTIYTHSFPPHNIS